MDILKKVPKKEWLGLAVFIVTFSFLVFLLLNSNGKKVVVFDKGVAISTLAKTLNSHHVDEKKQAKLIKQFGQAMTEILSEEAYQKQILIVPPASVIAGAEDKTEQLLPKIAKRMKENQAKVGGLHAKS